MSVEDCLGALRGKGKPQFRHVPALRRQDPLISSGAEIDSLCFQIRQRPRPNFGELRISNALLSVAERVPCVYFSLEPCTSLCASLTSKVGEIEDRLPNLGADLSVDEFFRPGGLLSESLDTWEDRPGQHEMATGVADAIRERRNLIVEAGTGTGKTLAYLVPLVLTGQRAVVSTGTKNLQEQLIQKDVPFLEEVLDHELRVAVMKGRNNFLCLQKLADQGAKPTLKGLEEVSEFSLIRSWAERTETGDRAELPELRDDSKLWPRLDARREACTGRRCELFERCFVTKMHQRARQADLIVVNHHLFFADLSLRRDDFGSIIPNYQGVVFDEAHEIEGVVGQFFGVRLSSFQFGELASDIRKAAKAGGFGSSRLNRRLKGLRDHAKEFFALFDEFESRQRFADRATFRKKHSDEYYALLKAIEGLHSHLTQVRGRSEETDPLKGRAQLLGLTLRTLLADVDRNVEEQAYEYPVLGLLVEDKRGDFVYWVEKRRRGVFLQATPIEVNSILNEALFDNQGSVILASATLAVDGRFDFIRGRLGLGSANELVVPGHFDYRRQALLYIPRYMPDPRAPDFIRRAVQEIQQLLRFSRGRAFVLCTSYQQMRRLHKEVSFAIEYRCLIQGQGPNAVVLDEFRKTPNCVLFATYSFWQGVDVPGEQLSCVIVDKLPFAVPSDPVVEARINRIRRQGGNPFWEFQIPAAALTLKQGFGRLIRRATDRGVLALLDNRIATKGYGKIFLNSLPNYARTSSLQDVAAFLGAKEDGGSSRKFRRAARRPRRPRRAGRYR